MCPGVGCACVDDAGGCLDVVYRCDCGGSWLPSEELEGEVREDTEVVFACTGDDATTDGGAARPIIRLVTLFAVP